MIENADQYNKQLETIKTNNSKIDNSIAERKINPETMDIKLYDTEEQYVVCKTE